MGSAAKVDVGEVACTGLPLLAPTDPAVGGPVGGAKRAEAVRLLVPPKELAGSLGPTCTCQVGPLTPWRLGLPTRV